MTEGRLSRRYSKALFELAREAGQEEQIGAEVASFHKAYSGSELQTVLTNPAFSSEARKNILSQVSQSLQLSTLTRHFLALLLERDRLGHLAGIVSCFRRLLNETKGRVEAKVVSPNALEPAMVDRLRDRLKSISGKDVVLEQATDPELLGGLMIELEGKIYDGSVRTQLERMKQRIARGY
ncbi:MAG TPA: ATP synthase F1 subunit delta [Terriglobales bacterium]|jgi:F-type H+-transporting ATPase subunit delta|nr:ATP synthase F1 subunit delta [Terriglobales bacterium]